MTAVERLAEIEARAAAATEGPWSAHDFGHSGAREPESIVVYAGPFTWNDVRDGEFVVTTPSWDSQNGADADFIAAVRQDVPTMVAALRVVLALADEYDTLSGQVYARVVLDLRAIDAALDVTS